jgi:hypothetical protein
VLRRALLLCSTCAIACGDPLAGTDYRGEPLAHIEGTIERLDPTDAVSAPTSLRVGLFWSVAALRSLTGTGSLARDGLVEQLGLSVSVRFPTSFVLNVFEPPRAPGLFALERGSIRIGQVLAYVDADGDGQFDDCAPGSSACDQWWGGAGGEALVFAEAAIPAAESPTHHALKAGYSRIRVPLDCAPPPPATPVANCGGALGAPCVEDDNCGASAPICLVPPADSLAKRSFCAKKLVPGACVPGNGAIVDLTGVGGWSLPTDVPARFYFEACEVDGDCRTSDGFACEPSTGACEPVRPMNLELEPALRIDDPFCVTAR